MKWYDGDFQELAENWKLSENPLWADYQVLGPMMSAYRTLAAFDDVLPVMVGAKGCSYHVRFAVVAMGETDFDLGKRPAFVLEYSPAQIVRGNFAIPPSWAKRLLEVMEGRLPAMIVLIPTDSMVLSGADMGQIADDMHKLTGIRTAYIESSSSTGQNPQTGYNEAMAVLLKPFYTKTSIKHEGINLLGWHWPSRQQKHEIGECMRMLKCLGIEVKSVISGGCSMENIEKAMTAAGSAPVCPAILGSYIDDMAANGVPLLTARSPYGFSGTEEWLSEICSGLGLDGEAAIKGLKEEYRTYFEENRAVLKGKKVFISGGPGRLIGLLHLMTDYGVEIEAAALFWPHKNSKRDLKHLLDAHGTNIKRIIVSPSLYELEEIAETAEIDVWCGGYQELHTCKRHGIPFVPITIYTVPHVGFAGAVNFGDKMRMALNGFCFTESVFNAKEMPECMMLHGKT